MRYTECDECKQRISGHRYVPDETWIALEASEDADHAQLCSWACLAAWSAKKSIDADTLIEPTS